MIKIVTLMLLVTCSLTNVQAQLLEDAYSRFRRSKTQELRRRFIPFKDSITGFAGVKSADNMVIVEPLYQSIESYITPDGYIMVQRNNKYGVIDTTGKTLIPCVWDHISMPGSNMREPFNNMVRVTTDATVKTAIVASLYYSQGRSGYVNMKNEVVVPVEYSFIGLYDYNELDDVVPFTKSECVVTARNWTLSENPYKKSRWGLVNSRNEIILPDDYYTYIGFGHGPYFVAFKGKRTTVIDKTGKRYTPLKYTKRTEYGKEIRKLYDEWAKGQQKHDDTVQ